MMNPYLLTFLWSITPIFELRASIPLGYLRFGLSIYEATLISIVGNIASAVLVLALLPTIVNFFEKYIPVFDRIMKRVFAHTRTRHSHRMKVVGEIMLILFVGIPLPGTGAWTGMLIAYLFGIRFLKATILVGLGVVMSGIIVAAVTLFGREIWDFVFNAAVGAVAP